MKSGLITLALTLLPALAAAQAAKPDSPYGVCGHLPSTAVLDRLQAAGIDWVRVDFDWWRLERARGVFDWRVTDRVVQDAHDRGIGVYATLAYTPGWANGGQHHSVPPTDVADWVRFVETVVARYQGKVRHWGMWNEPNLSHFWRGTRTEYIQKILIPGADAVKRIDSSGLVLGPDLAHIKSGDWADWLKDVLRRGGSKLDIVTHHTYKDGPRKAFRLLDGFTWFWEGPSVKRVIDRNGGAGKPVWITETGWTTNEHGESGQARRLEEWMSLFVQRNWLKKVFVYHAKDGPNGGDNWGLIRPDGTPRPALAAYEGFIATHPPVTGGAPPPVPPTTPPVSTWVFEAEAMSMQHEVGSRGPDGWVALPIDPPGYMVRGPNTHLITPGRRTASFWQEIFGSGASNDEVVTLEVYDANARQVLAQRLVRRSEFVSTAQYQEFTLGFDALAGQLLEFRTFFHGRVTTAQDRVDVH